MRSRNLNQHPSASHSQPKNATVAVGDGDRKRLRKNLLGSWHSGCIKKERLQNWSHKSRRRHTRRSARTLLIKEPIKNYSSIKIGKSGWKPLAEAVGEASQNHDFLLVEGAMSAFTGLLNDKGVRPTSTAEVGQRWEHRPLLWSVATKKA